MKKHNGQLDRSCNSEYRAMHSSGNIYIYIYIYLKILVGDANVYRDTNNNPVIFVIALRPFIPFLSKSTWEMRKIT